MERREYSWIYTNESQRLFKSLIKPRFIISLKNYGITKQELDYFNWNIENIRRVD